MGRQGQTSGQCTNKLRNTEDCQQHSRLEKAGRTLPEGLGEGTALVTPRSQTSAPRTVACATGAAALGNGLRVTWGPPLRGPVIATRLSAATWPMGQRGVRALALRRSHVSHLCSRHQQRAVPRPCPGGPQTQAALQCGSLRGSTMLPFVPQEH